MTPSVRADLLAKLEAGRNELLASVQGMSEEEAAAHEEGRWSAIGNIEHLAVSEAHLLSRIREAVPVEGEAVPGREGALFEGLKRRTRMVNAPAQAHPSGECRTLAEAMARFEAARGRTVAFVESCESDLRLCSTTHPLLGPITGMECIHMIAAHPFRHAAQIRELRGIAD